MHAIGAAYVQFATRDAALLELMYTAKHRESATDHAAADRAFAVVLDLIHQGQEEGALERDERSASASSSSRRHPRRGRDPARSPRRLRSSCARAPA